MHPPCEGLPRCVAGRQPVATEPGIVFVALSAIVLIGKVSVLATPYHWDEVVWIRLAHRLSQMHLWEVLPGLHPALEFRGRPPGLFLTTAGLFQVFGTSIWLSHFLVVCFALLGVWSAYLLGRFLHGSWVGILAAVWLFFDSLYFAQSAMFLADLPVTALGAATVYLALRGSRSGSSVKAHTARYSPCAVLDTVRRR